MGEPSRSPIEGALSSLHRFARHAAPNVPPAAERCELCAEPIPSTHRHLLEMTARRVCCVCRSCGLLFDHSTASLGKYRRIPERRLRLLDFQVSDAEWQELGVPVGLAFIRDSTPDGTVVASYPGPAGAVEAHVNEATWQRLQQRYPLLGTLEPDVEALLVLRQAGIQFADTNRVLGIQRYFLVPIDDCYRLVGIIRSRWQGITGGTTVWAEVTRFFEALELSCDSVASERS